MYSGNESQIIKFRDNAFEEYHSYPLFLEKVERKYGTSVVNNIKEMLKIKLKRKIVEEEIK